jgi:maleate isomerase
VTVHFARVAVTRIDLDESAMQQFAAAEMLAAADLLSHARVDAIAWNGTSAGWLGLDADREICRLIQARTGIRAVTSTLALVELLRRDGATSVAIVSPYTDDVQRRVTRTFETAGFDVVAERHLGMTDNFSFCEVPEETINGLVEHVAQAAPDAIVPFCTNLNAAPLVGELELALGVSIYDSTAAAVWAAADAAGAATTSLGAWGRALTAGAETPAAAARWRNS